MSNDEAPQPSDRPVLSRTLLGVLLAFLALAVLIALWALLTSDDGETADDGSTTVAAGLPTPLPLPSSTPTPDASVPTPIPSPTAIPTPIPEGFESCGDERTPLISGSYIVDTNTTPLNQRTTPSVDGTLVGAFDAGQTGLRFNGECVVNLADGYVWWQINNGSADVWIASSFVTPN